MAKPNYRFDKRQRELKKSQKQEEKRLKKLAKSAPDETTPAPDAGEQQPGDAASSTPEQTS